MNSSLITRKQIAPATSLRRERNLDRRESGGVGKSVSAYLRGTEVRSIRDIRRRAARRRGLLLSLSRPLCFWSPEDNEHNYGRVFVLEITQ